MSKVLRPTDVTGHLATINPVSQGVGTAVSGWIDISKFDKLKGKVAVGVLGAGATVDAKLQQATSSGGAGAKDIAGKAITQLTQAGADSNKQVLINLFSDELDVTGGFKFVQLSITVSVAASLIYGEMEGFTPRYAPASDNDAASVDEIIG
jgi:hypothetical protein